MEPIPLPPKASSVKKPAVKKPVAKKPIAKKPVVKRPTSSKVGTKKPASSPRAPGGPSSPAKKPASPKAEETKSSLFPAFYVAHIENSRDKHFVGFVKNKVEFFDMIHTFLEGASRTHILEAFKNWFDQTFPTPKTPIAFSIGDPKPVQLVGLNLQIVPVINYTITLIPSNAWSGSPDNWKSKTKQIYIHGFNLLE